MLKREKVQKCRDALAALLPAGFRPKIGLVLGTGLDGLAEGLENGVDIPFAALPDYPVPTVRSHAGGFRCGLLGGVPVIIQRGRCHLYEGRSPEDVALGVFVMAELGIETLIVTNAAGSLNPAMPAGSVMLMTDQINFTGQSPITGATEEDGRQRFTDMSAPFDREFAALTAAKAEDLGITLHQGVYLGLLGPQLETRAETAMFRLMGADALGMSTVLEVIAARYLGLRVIGLSALSNQNIPEAMQPVSLEEIMEGSRLAGYDLVKLISALVPAI